ncbi:hypothetical protein V8J82_06810 [Gymnodinialimonas sp. 2305UL16-5]|uniref:hypothetical protein n=1 Tax=Gymnodinialimonas mytili TaxID=3126503 RepID=UPI0030A49E37
MAKKPSKSKPDQTAETDSVAADTVEPTPSSDTVEGDLGGDTVLVGDGSLGEDSVAPEPDPDTAVTVEPGDTMAAERTDENDDASQTEIVDETPPPAATAPTPVVEQRGPGFGALLLGGIVAGAIGFAAAYFTFGQGADTSEQDAALVQALNTIEAQQGAIDTLQTQVAELAAIEPPTIPEVDLSSVEGQIAAAETQIGEADAAIDALTGRIEALEERPVFTGELDEDSAAMAAAVEALEARLNEERDAAAEAVAAAEAIQAAAASEVQEAAAAAQAAIAEAEARAQETAAATQAQAALSRVQIAMASGAPFADALADLPVEAPDALAAAAETGVPTLEELQRSFPAMAHATLSQAIRENAEDGSTAERVGAFFSAQLAGRSTEPREGTDPDAILSRAEAAVRAGDLETALTEIEALPPGARALLDDWASDVADRAAADAALADLAATLDN